MNRKCPECGVELPENAKFCVACGASITTTASKSTRANSSVNRQWLYIVGGLIVVTAIFIVYTVTGKPDVKVPPAGMNMSMGQRSGQATGDPRQGAMGDVTHELAALKERIAKDSTDYDAYLRLGDIYSRIGRFEQALGYYQNATRADASKSEAWGQLVYAAFQVGQFETALDGVDNMLEFDPSNAETMYNKGAILASMCRKEDARTVWEKLIKMAPDNPQAQKAKNDMQRL